MLGIGAIAARVRGPSRRAIAHRSVAAMSTSATHLPFVDMTALMDPSSSKSTRQPALDAMRSACRDFGFFTIPASVLPSGLLNKVYTRADEFNALPVSVKQKYHVRNVPNARGWTPLHEEPSYEPGVLSHVEGFDLAAELPKSYLDDDDQGLGPNVWPAEVPGFQGDVMGLYDVTTHVSNALFEAFAEMLDLPRPTFRAFNTVEAQAFMRLLTYPPPDPSSPNTTTIDAKHVGIAAHTDFECFTIIHQNNVGLQLKGRDGQWMDTPVAADRLFVLIGDVLEMWTNGVLVATPHRVLSAKTKRQSIVRFNGTEGKAWIEPLPQFVTRDAPAKYQRVTQRQHIQNEMHAAEAHLKETQEALEAGKA